MKFLISRIPLLIMVCLFSWGTFYFGILNTPHQLSGFFNEWQLALALVVILFLVVLILPRKNSPNSKLKVIFWLIVSLITFPLAVTKFIFGTNDLNGILIFFRDNQAQDIAVIGGDSFTLPIGISLFFFVLMILGVWYLLMRKRHFDTVLVIVAVLLFATSPVAVFVKDALFENELQANFDPEKEISINIIARPTEPRNLIVIYLESLERTFGELDATKAAYAPIQAVAHNSVEAVNVQQTFGTEYTIAGIVASQCGVPLLSPGLSNIFFKKGTEESLDRFLPSITCLGDVLAQDGYQMSYLNGASLNRFSKRGFFRTHGYTTLLGSDEVAPEIMTGRQNAFGMNDALLFGFVYDEYDRLSADGVPFAMNMLTLATHGPDAFLDNDCPVGENLDSQLPAAIACTARHIEKFMTYVRANPADRETDFVILSDHLALRNTLSKEMDAQGDGRRNLFIINTGQDVQVIDRASTPMDIFPTILDHLGYELENDQANLGQSMFGPAENLVERFGRDDLHRLLKGNQSLARYIWRDTPQ
jgi:phosphoglycerol transferase